MIRRALLYPGSMHTLLTNYLLAHSVTWEIHIVMVLRII